jgi:L-2-hydroxyglutarate oxidase LhgO
MERVDTIVVGAGVVGLAIARALALAGCEVLILEAEGAIGTVTSARNSGVIHAGLYYRPGSLKARLCVDGARQLYAYAAERRIPHVRCGKLVVATSQDQLDKLAAIVETGRQNGVAGLRTLSADEARAMEPEVACIAALHSPDSGIIDQHELMLALIGDAENCGATLATRTPVTGARIASEGLVLDVGGTSPMRIGCRHLVNAAGLGAQRLAHSIAGLDPASVPPLVLAKGNYFSLSGRPPFTMLVYPLPVPGSSGLHAMRDLDGRGRFGPDVEWVDRIDYRVDACRQAAFESAIRQYWPGLPEGALQPDYCGIRPKIGKGSPHDTDFIISTSRDHGIRGLINLYGIESPGLTSSLALGEVVASQLDI